MNMASRQVSPVYTLWTVLSYKPFLPNACDVIFNKFYTKSIYMIIMFCLSLNHSWSTQLPIENTKYYYENIQFSKNLWVGNTINNNLFILSVLESNKTDTMAINIMFNRRYHRILVISLYGVIAHNGAKSITLK